MKDYTVQLLSAVAERLSGRQNCRQVEYVVYVGTMDGFENQIIFYPYREVYPDIHHRQKTDLRDIVDHVVRTKFADTVYAQHDAYGHICFLEGSLTRGTYKYELSVDKKKRRWTRIH